MNKPALIKAIMATFCTVMAIALVLAVLVASVMKWGPLPLVIIPATTLGLWAIGDEYYKYFKRQS